MSRPRSDIRERLQHAARAQFLLHGVDGASLRAIAAAAGTNIGMVYYYFPTKDDLFVAAVEEIYKKLLGDFAVLLGETAPLREKLQRLYARMWRQSDDEYATIRLVMREGMVSGDRVQRLSQLFAQGHIPLLLQALVQGSNDGELREELPPLALLVSTMALGLMPMLAWRAAGQRLMPELALPDPDRLGALFASILLRGLGSSESSQSKLPKAPPSAKAARGTTRKKPPRIPR
jgi:AcrR family transcriptional regulator